MTVTSRPDSPIAQALAGWHDVARRRDPTGLAALLADDVVFISPVVHTPQVGRAKATLYLAGALQVLGNESFRYVREVVGERDAVLEFTAVIDGIEVNGVDLIRCDDAGRITEFKVMVRPLKGMQVLHQQMGQMLQALAAGKAV